MHGGLKIYRGSAAAARCYVEADRSRADDYYLTEGSGLAELYSASRESVGADRVRHLGSLDGDAYEQWVAGHDVATGDPKGRLRTDAKGVRFVEVVVNGPKTWSIAAAVHPELAAAYDAAQQRAAEEIIGWLAEHATTRVGSRGCQVQIPVTEIEAAVVRHYTSRAGDPHRHLHLQINARVLAGERWRGIHTVGVRDSLAAINGIGHAAVMCDPEFRTALAVHGYTLDSAGEVTQLAPYIGSFSARAAQIRTNLDRYEAEWRADHPAEEPGPALRQSWDRRAWAQARPDKVVPVDATRILTSWVDELHDLGYHPPTRPATLLATSVGGLDRDAIVETVLSRLGSLRSAWNAADIRGEVEQQIAAAGVLAGRAARAELAEDLTSRTLAACLPLLANRNVPEHVRALTSPRVLAVEEDLTTRLTTRAISSSAIPVGRPVSQVVSRTVRQWMRWERLDSTQQVAVAALAGCAELIVIEGAAGAGKTTTLSAAAAALACGQHQLLVVTPTRKAAEVAERQLGTKAFSAAWLIHQYGFRWDQDGRWTREPTYPALEAMLFPGDVLLVDEAGMLDQDTAHALLTIADETWTRIALVGDRHQLPAVGRGGVLDLAARYAAPGTHLTLDAVHRFTDPDYADLSLQMRTGEHADEVFDALLARGQIVIHASDVERTHALANEAAGVVGDDVLVTADTREQVAALNTAIRDRRVAAGVVTDQQAVVTTAGERISVGDRITTRRNDRDLDVANRETWTVTHVHSDRSLTVTCRGGDRRLPAAYVDRDVELGYASTVHGAQGETVTAAQVLIGDHTTAAAAYVAMTRGRDTNVAHLIADSPDDARRQWIEVFGRDRADLGPTHAAQRAAHDIERYGPNASPPARRTLGAGSPWGTSPSAHERSAYELRPGRPTTGPGIGR